MKYEIKYEIKKYEELCPNGNPTTVRQYVDDEGNTVEKTETVKELFHQQVTIDGVPFHVVVAFRVEGAKSIDTMSARDFINEILIPNTKMLNATIDSKYNKDAE